MKESRNQIRVQQTKYHISALWSWKKYHISLSFPWLYFFKKCYHINLPYLQSASLDIFLPICSSSENITDPVFSRTPKRHQSSLQETSVISAGSWLIILSQYFSHGQEERKEKRDGDREESPFSPLLPPPTLKIFLSFRSPIIIVPFVLWLLKGRKHRSGDSRLTPHFSDEKTFYRAVPWTPMVPINMSHSWVARLFLHHPPHSHFPLHSPCTLTLANYSKVTSRSAEIAYPILVTGLKRHWRGGFSSLVCS